MTKLAYKRLSAILLSISTAIALIAESASAQVADPDEMIARADANGDGDISWEEVTVLRADSFEKLDRNDDGVISLDDRPPGLLAGRFDEAFERVLASFDGDRDGQVAQTEMMGAPAPAFEQGDMNEDGVLTADEMAALRAAASQN